MIQKILGNGSYGDVAKAIDTQTNEIVAIKKIAHMFVDVEDTKRVLREIYILRHLHSPFIVRLRDVFVTSSFKSDNTLYIVMDYMETDLNKVISSNQFFEIDHVRYIIYQTLCGLLYMHSAGIIHRDIKPANILLNEDVSVKICDFGMARDLPPSLPQSTKPQGTGRDASGSSLQPRMTLSLADSPSPAQSPLQRTMTRHVVTRYYRSPELLVLGNYHQGVDVWSTGCITAELLQMLQVNQADYHLRQPLFPGKYSSLSPRNSSPTTYISADIELKEDDQICTICSVLGRPPDSFLQKVQMEQVRKTLESYSNQTVQWSQRFHYIPSDLSDLLSKMLDFEESTRITTKKALEHPFFDCIRDLGIELECEVPINWQRLKDLSSMDLQQMMDFLKEELELWDHQRSE